MKKPPRNITEAFVYELLLYKMDELRLRRRMLVLCGLDYTATAEEILKYRNLSLTFGSIGLQNLPKYSRKIIGSAFDDFCQSPSAISIEGLSEISNDFKTYINSI